jgi:hypothetical protein
VKPDSPDSGSNGQTVDAMTTTNVEFLDTTSDGETLANLQLYGCAAGCAPNTTVVAWTHSSQQRYAQVQGGG